MRGTDSRRSDSAWRSSMPRSRPPGSTRVSRTGPSDPRASTVPLLHVSRAPAVVSARRPSGTSSALSGNGSSEGPLQPRPRLTAQPGHGRQHSRREGHAVDPPLQEHLHPSGPSRRRITVSVARFGAVHSPSGGRSRARAVSRSGVAGLGAFRLDHPRPAGDDLDLDGTPQR